MPYTTSGIPGQMYNSATGYAAQQNAPMASKPPYNAQNPNKVGAFLLLVLFSSDTCHRSSSNTAIIPDPDMGIHSTANLKPQLERARFGHFGF